MSTTKQTVLQYNKPTIRLEIKEDNDVVGHGTATVEMVYTSNKSKGNCSVHYYYLFTALEMIDGVFKGQNMREHFNALQYGNDDVKHSFKEKFKLQFVTKAIKNPLPKPTENGSTPYKTELELTVENLNMIAKTLCDYKVKDYTPAKEIKAVPADINATPLSETSKEVAAEAKKHSKNN